jgi:hypothetical protein
MTASVARLSTNSKSELSSVEGRNPSDLHEHICGEPQHFAHVAGECVGVNVYRLLFAGNFSEPSICGKSMSIV